MNRSTIKIHNAGFETVNVPQVPNFIRRVSDNFPIPVGELTDAQLKKIGKAWIEALLKNAEKQRTNLKTDSDYYSR